MTREKRTASRLVLPAAALLAAACSPSPTVEGQLLRAYFHACRLGDATLMARLGSASCSPREIGVVQSFEIEQVAGTAPAAGVEAEEAREVRLAVRARTLDGRTLDGTMTATLHRVEGRWVVAALTPPRASRISPGASSTPPS